MAKLSKEACNYVSNPALQERRLYHFHSYIIVMDVYGVLKDALRANW